MISAQTTALPMTLGERIWYALRRGHVGVGEMADELGITRQALGRWIADGNKRGVPQLYLKTIALRCGIRHEWLRDGTGSPFAGEMEPDDAAVTTNHYPLDNLDAAMVA